MDPQLDRTSVAIPLSPKQEEFLSELAAVSDQPSDLVEFADIDPISFEAFLSESGLLHDPEAQLLLRASQARSPSQEGPSQTQDKYGRSSSTKQRQGSRTLDLYLRDIEQVPLLKLEQEADLAQRIKEGDQEALYKLVRANLRFVVSVAKKYQGKGLPFAHLINAGNYGLIKAARRFDATHGFNFMSYAVWWIRASIGTELSEHSKGGYSSTDDEESFKVAMERRLVRLPSREATVIRLYFGIGLERSLTLEEIGEQLGLTRERVRQIKDRALRMLRRQNLSDEPRVALYQRCVEVREFEEEAGYSLTAS